MELLIISSASLTIAVVLLVMKGLWALSPIGYQSVPADRAPVLL